MIQLDSILTLAKSMTTKVVKDDSKLPVVVCVMKFSGLEIRDRDTVDELLGMEIGWCRDKLYDEQGAPRKRFGLTVFGQCHRVSGTVAGRKASEVLKLLQAEVTEIHLSLIAQGAVAEGTLTWAARGDEVEDLEKLLGQVCTVKWEITNEGQDDMFDPRGKGASEAARETQRTLDELAKRRKGNNPAGGAASDR
jgi:hypothetical protein